MKTFEQIYRLSEQMYDKKKVYYHISPNKFTKFENRQGFRKGDEDAIGGVFLTPRLYMIQKYGYEYLSDHYEDQDFYVYKCMLNRPLNIFNPSSYKDRSAFAKEVSKDPREFFLNYGSKQFKTLEQNLSQELTRIFSTHEWTSMENPAITKIVKTLGFDGYVSQEHNVGNLMIFNANDISIVKWDNKSKTIWKTIDFSKNRNMQVFGDDDKIVTDWNKNELEDLRNQRKFYMSYNNDVNKFSFNKNVVGRGNRHKQPIEREFNEWRFDEIENSIFEITTTTDKEQQNGDDVRSYSLLPAMDNQGHIILSRFESMCAKMGKNDVYYFDDKEFDNVNSLQYYIIDKFDLGDEPEENNYSYNPYKDDDIEF